VGEVGERGGFLDLLNVALDVPQALSVPVSSTDTEIDKLLTADCAGCATSSPA